MLVFHALLGHSVSMSKGKPFPDFAIVAAVLLVGSFIGGQLWLHRSASPKTIMGARQALAECGAAPSEISTYWDVVRAYDRSYLHTISGLLGIDGSC